LLAVNAGTSREPFRRSASLTKQVLRVAHVDERGCRRDIRSNGWIVILREPAPAKGRSGRRNRFSSFGADRKWFAISPARWPYGLKACCEIWS
jgi:hypothetical protein